MTENPSDYTEDDLEEYKYKLETHFDYPTYHYEYKEKEKHIFCILRVKLYFVSAKLNRKSETSKRFRIFLLCFNVF